MHFSGKISHSLIAQLRESNKDLEGLFELTDLPREMLVDSSSWIEGQKLESFLERALAVYGTKTPQWLRQLGHRASELKAWGVLDSVLRLMESPGQIFRDPEKIFSYFISPPPPLQVLPTSEEKPTEMHLQIPISFEEYPHVFEYLIGAIEGIPPYMGLSPARVDWKGDHLMLDWHQEQTHLIDPAEEAQTFNPKLFSKLLAELESRERELEAARKNLQRLEGLLEEAETQGPIVSVQEELAEETTREEVRNILDFSFLSYEHQHQTLMRLVDYLNRAQQMTTLLQSKVPMDKGLREILKKMDWERVPKIMETLIGEYRSEYHLISDQFAQWRKSFGDMERPEAVEVGPLVREMLAELQETKSNVTYESQVFYEGSVRMYREDFRKTFKNLMMTFAESKLNFSEAIHLSVRPEGGRLDFELSKAGSVEDSASVANMARGLARRYGGKTWLSQAESSCSLHIQIPLKSH